MAEKAQHMKLQWNSIRKRKEQQLRANYHKEVMILRIIVRISFGFSAFSE